MEGSVDVGARSTSLGDDGRGAQRGVRLGHPLGDWLVMLVLEGSLAVQEILAFAYVLVGLVLASAPAVYVVLRQGAEIRARVGSILRPALLIGACLVVAAATGFIDGAAFLVGAVVLGAAMAAFARQDRLGALFLCLAAVGAAGTLLWWKYDADHVLTIEYKYLACFFAALLAISLPALMSNARNRKVDLLFIVIIAIFVLQHSTNVSILGVDDVYSAVRHHWGAYIGPSETMLSGARLLYDIPAQYGLGPTLLIAAACGKNCWYGMYWITTAAGVIYALLIVVSAGVIARKSDNSWTYGVTLLAGAAACMVWTSYPPQLGGPWSFPSTGGLRFIPLCALLLFILWRESRSAEGRPSRFYGHALWCLGALWSPESAFYLSFVWWPYRLWSAGARSAQPLRAAVFAGVELLAVAVGLLVVFVGLFYAVYGVIPSFSVYIAYVVNPIGPQAPDLLGSMWFFFFAMVAGIGVAASLIGNRVRDSEFASLFVCILALFAVFSYYIGRSHDNNILNLMPYLVLVLAAVQSSTGASALSRGAFVALASTLATVMFFGWSAWRQTSWSDYANAAPAVSMSYIRGPTAEQSGAAALPAPDGQPQNGAQDTEKSRLDGANPADAARAVFYVSSVRGEPLIKIDDGLDIAPIGPAAWSAIHDPIDFYFLPDSLVAELIDRTMRRIRSPGWLVIAKHVDDDPQTQRWQRLLEASYVKTEEMDFGAYHAIRYKPNLR